ncbi:MAG: hypothetical protein LBF25_01795 [Puniceicoccales bacterium]|jgi:hypothetical protein|nr:hypothetical protein [Puniceicoccales bacterium]
MEKMWKKLCALTGLFVLLMFSPRGLLADPWDEEFQEVAPEEYTVPVDDPAGNLWNASFVSTAAGESQSVALTASGVTEERAKKMPMRTLSATFICLLIQILNRGIKMKSPSSAKNITVKLTSLTWVWRLPM